MRLFAERGYERTSVPDIQAAAGLAAGSGAMYKHYPSKDAVLREGMEQFARASSDARSGLHNTDAPPLLAFDVLVRQALALLASERNEIRVAWRELEQFPDLLAHVRSAVMQSSYRDVAAWLHAHAEAGTLRPHDSDAVAAVLLGSVVMYRVFEALWGERAIPIDDERFIRAWLEIAVRGLAPEGTEAQQPSLAKPASSARRGKKPGRRPTRGKS